MVTTCKHADVTRGQVYDYCEICGAVRTTTRLGKPETEWHSCDNCRLPKGA